MLLYSKIAEIPFLTLYTIIKFCCLFSKFSSFKGIKGSVQRKLRWVENGVNRRGTSDCGPEHSFVVFFGFHLDFTIFPFPVSTALVIDEFWKNK